MGPLATVHPAELLDQWSFASEDSGLVAVGLEQIVLAWSSVLQLPFVPQSNLSARSAELADPSDVVESGGSPERRAFSASALLPFGLASRRRSITSWRSLLSVV